MTPLTRDMIYFFNSNGWSYCVHGDTITVEVAGVEYVIQRLDLRYWRLKRSGPSVVFKSQWEVIAWLESRL